MYRLYNETGLAAISSMPIDPSNLQSSSEPLIDPLLVALNDSNSKIRNRAARALGDIRSVEAIDPLINRLKDEDIKVQDSSALALRKITGVDLDKDQQKWMEWREKSTNAVGRVQFPQENISAKALPTYSQILATYPEGALGIYGVRTEGNVTKVTDEGWDLNLTQIEIKNGDAVIQGYGTKITLDVPVTVDGKTFDAGSKLTVDKDLNWVEVSSWD
ncbi:HEAT repeat domain-containing protein [Methanothrix sp.]|uniref:HEAT repeat domain-containing protein n=1 Tax=Methanothrix sp. TaxID=90426 RepID=UPI003BB20C0E